MARKKKPEEHENHERWLVSYADFITLLFAFFVVMYSVSSVNEGKFRAAADSISQAFHPVINLSASPVRIDAKVTNTLPNIISPDFKTYQKLQDTMKEAGDLGDKVKVDMDKRGIVVRVADTLVFDTGKAEVRPEAREVLKKVGAVLAGGNKQVRVEGHTDNVPIKTAHFPSNWELSTDRASAIVRYFIDNTNMKPPLLSAAGYAHYKPLESNDTPAGRAKNRRVDIVVLNDQEAAQEPGILQ